MTFKVTLQNSGESFSIAANETILSGALGACVNLPYGCRNGACGACKGQVLDGEVEYGDLQTTALSEADRQAGKALFCCAKAKSDLVIECRTIKNAGGIRPKIMPCRVEKLERVAHDVMRMQLKLPSNERLQFLAGQYIEFILRDGQRRAFSIANAPHEEAMLELHLRHIEGGKFTDQVFNEMQEKAILRIEAPLGSFAINEESQKSIIFVAGGTGFAPIKGMIDHLLHEGTQRQLVLYRGVRALKDLYLPELAEVWRQRYAGFSDHVVLSEPATEDQWTDRTGLVHQAVLADYPDLSEVEVYCCGAPALIDVARIDFMARGLPEEAFFADAFTFAAGN